MEILNRDRNRRGRPKDRNINQMGQSLLTWVGNAKDSVKQLLCSGAKKVDKSARGLGSIINYKKIQLSPPGPSPPPLPLDLSRACFSQ